jgi:hypothetical protein
MATVLGLLVEVTIVPLCNSFPVFDCPTHRGNNRTPYSSDLNQAEMCLLQKRDEVTGDWRKLHNEELHNLYSSPNIIGIIK